MKGPGDTEPECVGNNPQNNKVANVFTVWAG